MIGHRSHAENVGYWVVRVDRETGEATTELVHDKDEAWQRSIDIAGRGVFATVVGRRVRLR